ncbi:putative zinc finger protein VAR3, chloroplastic-like [Capsicum annuum]|nr:putative zinc finger protein VAR3, chloroplastic-like [Capsicum annuum]
MIAKRCIYHLIRVKDSRLTQEKVKFQWLDSCEKSFQELKTQLMSSFDSARGFRWFYGGVWVQNGSESFLVSEVKKKQDSDPIFIRLKEEVQDQKIQVIMDRIAKSVYFLPVNTSYSDEDYARLYLRKLVKLHGVQLTIISYRDMRRRELEFNVGDFIYLKSSPMKGVKRFGKKGKLSPRYVGPCKILSRYGKVAYELELPAELASVDLVFYVSLLNKCIGDPTSIVPLERIGMENSLSYEEFSVWTITIQIALSTFLFHSATALIPELDFEILLRLSFEQNLAQISGVLMPLYLNSQILGALQESFASELAARMNAMSSATNNVVELRRNLFIAYNRERQVTFSFRLIHFTTSVGKVSTTCVCYCSRAGRKNFKKSIEEWRQIQPTSEDGTMVQPLPAEMNNMWTTVVGGSKKDRTYGTRVLQSSSTPPLFPSSSSTLQTVEEMEAMKKQIMELMQKCAANDARFAKFDKLEELVKKHMPQLFYDEEDNESDDN